MGEKETFAFRLENDTAEEVKEYVDERGVKKSDVLRRATKEYIDEQTGEAGGARRSVSPLTILGLGAVAWGLLATGYTQVGGVLGIFAAVYALLWVTAYDTVLEGALDDARDELREVGGVVGFFRYVATDHHVEDPDTVVERAARLDLYAPIAGGLALVVGGAAVVLYSLGYFAAVVGVIGPWGVFGWGLLVLGLAYLFAVMLAISALASLAIATAASSTPTADADTDPDA